MRLDARSPDHDWSRRWEVRLNGIVLKNATMADDEKGEALIAVLDERARLQVIGDEVPYEIVCGKIEIFEITQEGLMAVRNEDERALMDDETIRLTALALGPDDILVLTAANCLSMETVERLRQKLGVSNRVIVLDDGMKLEVLRPTPEIYDGLPPLEAEGRFIGYAADGSAWVLSQLSMYENRKAWGAAGFEENEGYGNRPIVKLLTHDLADFIVVSVPAMMPKRPREAGHGEATDQAASDTQGPEQRDAAVPGRGDGPGEASDQAQDDEGAGRAGAGGGGAGEEAEALKNE